LTDELGRERITFAVARLKGHVREQFDLTGLTDRLGEEHFFGTVALAVDWCATRNH
jgi:hypothetical protein